MNIFDLFRLKKQGEPTYDTTDRYQLEHLILRQGVFSESGPNILTALLEQKGNFLVSLYNTINKDNPDYRCRYSAEDFKIQGVHLAEKGQEKLIIQIQMPKPERSTLCNSIYIVHDENFDNRRYITTELSDSGLVFCEWDVYGRHSYYGIYSEKSLKKIIFM